MPIDPAPRRGRRDNGLHTIGYVPLGDVDPRIGEHLLDVLGAAGVPAYLEPSADVEPYTRTLALPSPPTDRLWVDREQRAQAGRIVAAEGGVGPAEPAPEWRDDRPSTGLDDVDEELVWRQIVAAFSSSTQAAVPPWPTAEDAEPSVGAGGLDAADDAGAADRPQRGGPAGAGDPAADHGADQPAPDHPTTDDTGRAAPGPAEPVDEEEHYVPPPPPPVPRLSRQALLGIGLVVLGALLLIAPGVLGVDQDAGLTFGVLAVLAGAAVLVLRLRDSRSDDGPDDGAVV